jgi:Flp pilus assembly protein TadG
MKTPTPNHSVIARRRGAIWLYFLFGIITFTALVSLGVDVAHVRVVKSQLQNAADLAARAAAWKLQGGTTAAQNAAVTVAAANRADGVAVALNAATDVEFGTWLNGTFTSLPSATGANAVRVTAARTTAKGNAVQLAFGRLIGLSTFSTSAQSIATGTPTLVAGFIGYNGVTAKNNVFFGGYHSDVTTTPTHNSTDSNMRVGSNTALTGFNPNNNILEGDALLGPCATVNDIQVQGCTNQLSSPIPTTA